MVWSSCPAQKTANTDCIEPAGFKYLQVWRLNSPLACHVPGFVCTHGKVCFFLCLTVTSCNSVYAHGLCIFVRHCWERCNTNQSCPSSALGRVGRQPGMRREGQNLDGLRHNLLCRSHPSIQHQHGVPAIWRDIRHYMQYFPFLYSVLSCFIKPFVVRSLLLRSRKSPVPSPPTTPALSPPHSPGFQLALQPSQYPLIPTSLSHKACSASCITDSGIKSY